MMPNDETISPEAENSEANLDTSLKENADNKLSETLADKGIRYSDKLEAFRRKLLDLSNRNRLLNYSQNARSLQIVDELPDQIFDKLVTKGKAFTFLPLPEQKPGESKLDAELPTASPDPEKIEKKHTDANLQTNLEEEALDIRLNKIRLDANREQQETGGSSLFIAIGFLEWRDKEFPDKARLAPLTLIPVNLSRTYRQSRASYHYRIEYSGDDLQRNESLAEKLLVEYGLELPPLDNETSPEAYFKQVADSTVRQQQWVIRREAVLGFFNFHKLLMYRDLNPENWCDENGMPEDGSLVLDLFEGQGLSPADEIIGEYHIDENADYRDLPLPLDADSSQHSAIIDASRGTSFVLQGPPGTGKSQTITNLIAWAIGHGKTILFVAEKQAALNVVESRLQQIKLDPFCLQLHSQKSKPAEVFHQISQRLDATFRNRHNRDQKLNDQHQHRMMIDDYLKAIAIVVGPNDETLDQVFWKVAALRDRQKQFADTALLPQTPQELDLSQFDLCNQFFHEFERHFEEVKPIKSHPWQWYAADKYFGQHEAQMLAILNQFIEVTDNLAEEHAKLASAGLADAQQNNQEEETAHTHWPALHELESLPDRFPEQALLKLKIPDDFVQAFARQRTQASLEELANIITSIRELARLREQPGLWRMTDTSETDQPLQSARKSLQLMSESEALKLLTGFDLSEIRRLSKFLISAEKELKQSIALGTLLKEKGYGDATSMTNLEAALTRYQHFQAPVISNCESVTETLFSIQARETYQKAKAKFLSIKKKEADLAEYFDLPPINETELNRLKQLQKQIKLYLGKWTRHFSSEYKQLKREVRLMMTKPQDYQFGEALDQQLRDLIEFMEAYSAYGETPIYIERLGEFFKGHETDWGHLDELFGWADKAMSYRYSHEDVLSMLKELDENKSLPTIKDIESCIQRLRDCLGSDAVRTLKLNDEKVWSIPFDAFLSQLTESLHDINRFLDELENLPTLNVDTMLETKQQLETLIAVSEFRQSINQDPHWPEILGSAYAADQTSPEGLEKTLAWLQVVDKLDLPLSIKHWLYLKDASERQQLLSACLQACIALAPALSQPLKALTTFTDQSFKIPVLDPEVAPSLSSAASSYFKDLQNSMADLLAWANYCRELNKGRELKLSHWLDQVWQGSLTPQSAQNAYQLAIYEAIANDAVEKDDRLKDFSRQKLESHRDQFVDLDQQILKINQQILAYQSSQRQVPEGVTKGRVAQLTEMGIIQNEVKKQKRHIRIRQLFERAAEAVQALTPCIMMSPLSVSRYLPSDVKFDLVVMDEASQINTEDALGALLRGKQAVIVGDPKQLPPTDFFNTIQEEEDDDEIDENESIADNTESVLEAAGKAMRHDRLLRWHYRSKHEKLIAFSNEKFYDEKLIIFPSPTTDGGGLGIVHHEIPEGHYHRGINDAEAQAVADAVIRHIQNKPKETLGIVAFNSRQMERIQYWLDKKKAESQDMLTLVDRWESREDEPLFVKNLENVQGDERDVIFISYTYGPEKESGRVFQRFGPIGRDNGWRRLNVLVTRAKRRIEVFASIKPAEIEGGEDRPGVEAMKDYLSYALSGGQLIKRQQHETEPGDIPFEEAIARCIRRLGYEVETQVGVADFRIDIAVRVPDKDDEYVLAILCDGASYAEAQSARDRDRLREAVLRNRGWKIHRVWSMDWFINQAVEEKRLEEALVPLK